MFFIYIRYEQASKVGCDDAGQRTNTVHKCHDSASVVGREVQTVHLEAGVEEAHKSHPNDQTPSDYLLVTLGHGGSYYTESWAQ